MDVGTSPLELGELVSTTTSTADPEIYGSDYLPPRSCRPIFAHTTGRASFNVGMGWDGNRFSATYKLQELLGWKKKELCGSMTLLQVWIYERFPGLCPTHRQSYLIQHPRALRFVKIPLKYANVPFNRYAGHTGTPPHNC
ncbi:hypothetical protein POM88_048785 [Heracleum sosnowskyi]|uniref:Uncharacterized protein n=1 Tax=Heracleum sosnowskyi TaxID=360622 RepID=A0AAD8GWG5_9APIA|nr:hypothetical protein POM88_048785 [Heracleum sosnowskyi]